MLYGQRHSWKQKQNYWFSRPNILPIYWGIITNRLYTLEIQSGLYIIIGQALCLWFEEKILCKWDHHRIKHAIGSFIWKHHFDTIAKWIAKFDWLFWSCVPKKKKTYTRGWQWG